MKDKLINILINIYTVFVFFSACIVMIQILKHFDILNTGTGFIILCINIALFPLMDIKKEETKK